MVKLFATNIEKRVIVNHKIIPTDFMNGRYTVGFSHKVGKHTTIQCKPGLVINLSERDSGRLLTSAKRPHGKS